MKKLIIETEIHLIQETAAVHREDTLIGKIGLFGADF